MKNVLSTIVAALAVSVFSTAVFAAVPCPQGMSCSENYQMQIPQVAKSAEKKELSPEQIATRQKEVSEARKRDLDKTLVYTKTSQTDNCLYWELDSKVDDLLIKNPDIVVDRDRKSVV